MKGNRCQGWKAMIAQMVKRRRALRFLAADISDFSASFPPRQFRNQMSRPGVYCDLTGEGDTRVVGTSFAIELRNIINAQ